MMLTQSRYYRFGDLTVALHGPSFSETSYFHTFRCEKSPATVDFTVTVAPLPVLPAESPIKSSLHEAEYRQNGRRLRVMFQEHSKKPLLSQIEEDDGRYQVCLEPSCLPLYDTNLVLKLLELPKLLLHYGGLFLHASYIDTGGKALLFTAPKQTGKSTQAALWQRYRGAEIINGDRALLRRTNGTWTAYGSPYCGTSRICKNRKLPIDAIILLRRGEKNEIRPAPAQEAVAAFLSGCSYDPETQSGAVLDLALQLWQEIPVLTFACRPDESAVLCLENALSQFSFKTRNP